jgi:hypothetical protein
MNTLQKLLVGAALTQAALFAFTWIPRGASSHEPRDLLGMPVEQIQNVKVHGRNTRDEKAPSKPVSLTRTESGWILDSSDGYPASETYVKPLLDNLAKLRVREPIATKAESFATLEVADENHTRKVEITGKDGSSRVLYLGAGTGPVTHVRMAGEEEAFDVKGFTAWSLAENDNRYYERDLMKVPVDQLRAVTLKRPGEGVVSFALDGGGEWTVTGFGEGRAIDQAAVKNYLGNLLQLRMLQPEGREVKPEMGFDDGYRVTWTQLENGAEVPHSYTVGALIPVAEGRRYLQLDTTPFVFLANKGNIASAVEKDLNTLFQGPVDVP